MSDPREDFWKNAEQVEILFRSWELRKRFQVLQAVAFGHSDLLDKIGTMKPLNEQSGDELRDAALVLIFETLFYAGISSFVEVAESYGIDSTPLLDYLDSQRQEKLRDALNGVRRTAIRASVDVNEEYEVDLSEVIGAITNSLPSASESPAGNSMLISEAAALKKTTPKTIRAAIKSGKLNEIAGADPQRVVDDQKFRNWEPDSRKVRSADAEPVDPVKPPRSWKCRDCGAKFAAEPETCGYRGCPSTDFDRI